MKFERPSKVQAKTLPMILTPPNRDLIAQAHNGSGKTTCFVLSMLSRVNPTLREPQALCACPTRELVIQNLMVLQKMAKWVARQEVPLPSAQCCDDAQDACGPVAYEPSTLTCGLVLGQTEVWPGARTD
jgi:superfamily II DNA/RNA helicase